MREWLQDVQREMETDTVGGLLLGAYYAYAGVWLTLSTRLCLETNVFEREWDVLILLDTCRVDALEKVADEYEFIETVDRLWSVGSTSGEWVARTFDRQYREQIAKTSYVTANPHSDAVLRQRNAPPQYVATPATAPDWSYVSPDQLLRLDEVWKYGTDESLGVVPPRVTTDRAIEAARTGDQDRLIVHYMQPHEPYIADEEVWETPIEDLRKGKTSSDEVWTAYLDNLRLVLDDVELFLENADADRVVISADHGELFGEWHNYAHPVGFLHPAVKRVPWVETEATDTETHEPDTYETVPDVDDQTRDHLSSLGYY